jgi:LCP family protein required for cell wall assembly
MATSTRRRRSSYDLTPPWMTTRRVVAAIAGAVVLLVAVFATRTVLGLGHLTNQNPLAVIGDLVGGKGGSSINQAAKDMRRLNFAFYGFGGPGHDGAYLSDSIMVISVQPQASGPPKVAEISLPRDWYVPIALGNGKKDAGRINQAYSDGMSGSGTLPAGDRAAGATVANATLEHLLGIHIDHWVGLDFQAFKSAVDAVGGVDVVVPNSFTDYQYPAGECNNSATSNCAYMTVHFNAGPQHLDGTRALQFARSRHSTDNGEGTDFARSRRQQLVVAALKQRVVSLGGLGSLPDLLNSLGDNVVTDLHVNDLEALYALLKDVDNKAILHVSFDDANFLYECGYPRNCGAAFIYAHDRSYAQVAHYVQSIFVDPKALGEHAKVTIQDASGRGLGAAGRWSTLLNFLSLQTVDGGTTARRQAVTQVIDQSGGRDAATAAWLAKYFGVTVTHPPSAAPATGKPTPTASPAAADGGVLVILGQDEETAFLGNPGVGG